MNYPYGSYDDRVIKYISELGCCLGLTTEVQRADIRMDDRYKLPRFDCNDFPPKSNIIRLVRKREESISICSQVF